MKCKEEPFDGFAWYVLDENHKPIPIKSHYEFFDWKGNNKDSILVRQEYVNDHVFISTAFIGLDHRRLLSEKPLLWETCVFSAIYPELEDSCFNRYSSYEQAVTGHTHAISHVKIYLLKLKSLELNEQENSTSIYKF
jgi:hypothetical protein